MAKINLCLILWPYPLYFGLIFQMAGAFSDFQNWVLKLFVVLSDSCATILLFISSGIFSMISQRRK